MAPAVKKKTPDMWVVIREVREYRRKLSELLQENPEFMEDWTHYTDPDTVDYETFIEEV